MKKGTVPSDDWQAEDDLRTICRAREIEKDPKRMAKVKALAKSRTAEMAVITNSGKK
jgi:hypothetical protein